MGKGRITEAALLTYAENDGGFHVSSEQKRLLVQRGDAHGMSRGSFLAWVERYYKCRKAIVITSDFNINRSSTLRKLDVDEYVELLVFVVEPCPMVRLDGSLSEEVRVRVSCRRNQ